MLWFANRRDMMLGLAGMGHGYTYGLGRNVGEELVVFFNRSNFYRVSRGLYKKKWF